MSNRDDPAEPLALAELLKAFRQRRPVRAGSLIVTVFGDTIAPHGNAIWLGSLIECLAPFGLNPRQVRTAVYRLCQNDWLEARRVGRRSDYGFSDNGRSHYEKAARRIYAAELPDWDGTWTLALPVGLKDRERDQLRQELQWLGFGTMVPGLMAHPNAERRSLDETLREMDCTDRVAVLNAHSDDPTSGEAVIRLAHRCWNLDDLGHRYRSFIACFEPALEALQREGPWGGRHSFLLRTLLIHDYRRILLRDADLPTELLPDGWPGHAARELVARIYRELAPHAESYIVGSLVSTNGPLPAVDGHLPDRFEGPG